MGAGRHRQLFTAEQRALSNAHQIGITLEEYRAEKALGRKWCFRCRCFVSCEGFGRNQSNYDGLASMCRSCKAGYDKAYTAKQRRLSRQRSTAA